jgi:AmmeMemoRadiSam system protein A/AmmeMemoRadiSam system protein B
MVDYGSLVFSGIAPHPPIMVPEVGRESIAEVRRSIDGMAELTRRIIESGATSIILISPHAPLDPTAFVVYEGPRLIGDFSNFRAPMARVEADVDNQLLEAIKESASADNYEVIGLETMRLDHGTAVPLYFLQQNGWKGAVVALGYSYLSNEDHFHFGECVRRAVDHIGRRVAFVASGDLSHRLRPEAPAGYNPVAHIFDEEVVEALQTKDLQRIIHIDPELRRMAGECGYRSLLVALGATKEIPPACDVLSYEAPFGVGYLVAQITSSRTSNSSGVTAPHLESEGTETVTRIARDAIETFVRTGAKIRPPVSPSGMLDARAGCFVSIKTTEGELRGCIGTIEPTEDTLAEEIITNALNACTRDPRFPPVAPDELPELIYSVDILSSPESTTFEDLNPNVYGVIVEDERGLRRGLLLPDIQGVSTAKQQVEIASRKAGIDFDEPVRLYRFSVQRFRE